MYFIIWLIEKCVVDIFIGIFIFLWDYFLEVLFGFRFIDKWIVIVILYIRIKYIIIIVIYVVEIIMIEKCLYIYWKL